MCVDGNSRSLRHLVKKKKKLNKPGSDNCENVSFHFEKFSSTILDKYCIAHSKAASHREIVEIVEIN